MSQHTFISEFPKPLPLFEAPCLAEGFASPSPCPDGPFEPTLSDELYARSNSIGSKGTPPSPSSSSHGPKHYKRGKIEVWDFIRDQRLDYHLGNAIKYICRAGHKDSKADDLKKAIHYLQNELEHST